MSRLHRRVGVGAGCHRLVGAEGDIDGNLRAGAKIGEAARGRLDRRRCAHEERRCVGRKHACAQQSSCKSEYLDCFRDFFEYFRVTPCQFFSWPSAGPDYFADHSANIICVGVYRCFRTNVHGKRADIPYFGCSFTLTFSRVVHHSYRGLIACRVCASVAYEFCPAYSRCCPLCRPVC